MPKTGMFSERNTGEHVSHKGGKKGLGFLVSPYKKLERVKRFELSTSTLARSRSTTELHPHYVASKSCVAEHSLPLWSICRKIFLRRFFAAPLAEKFL